MWKFVLTEMGLFFYLVNIALLLITAGYAYIKWKHGYWARLGIPYDKPSLIMGSLKGIGKKFTIGGKVNMVYEELHHNAKIVGMYLMVRPLTVVCDLDLVRKILIADFQKLSDRGLYWDEEEEPLSANLLNLPLDRWKPRRAKLSPTFNSAKMKLMMPIIATVSDVLVEQLKRSDGQPKDVMDVFSCYTTDVIGTCAFGIDCNSLEDPNTEFAKYVRMMAEPPKKHPIKATFNLAFGALSRKLGIKQMRSEWNEFFHRLVGDMVDYREKENVQRDDFLNILIKLKAEGQLTLSQIAAEVFIFQFAGFDTSAATLTYAAYELAVNPQIQEKVREEVFRVKKEFNNDLTYEAIFAMPYLDRVLNEVLRKYPPFTSIFRRVTDPIYEISGTDVVLKKDSLVAIPTLGIQHNPSIYPNPKKFDPDRFLPEEVDRRHSMAYLPFGEGPRRCIGLRFAMMENKMALAKVLTNVRLETTDDTPDEIKFATRGIILKPANKIYLKFIKLDEE